MKITKYLWRGMFLTPLYIILSTNVLCAGQNNLETPSLHHHHHRDHNQSNVTAVYGSFASFYPISGTQVVAGPGQAIPFTETSSSHGVDQDLSLSEFTVREKGVYLVDFGIAADRPTSPNIAVQLFVNNVPVSYGAIPLPIDGAVLGRNRLFVQLNADDVLTVRNIDTSGVISISSRVPQNNQQVVSAYIDIQRIATRFSRTSNSSSSTSE